MSNDNNGLGDIITAKGAKKLHLVAGLLNWYGDFLIGRSLLGLLKMDKASRDGRALAKMNWLNVDYSDRL